MASTPTKEGVHIALSKIKVNVKTMSSQCALAEEQQTQAKDALVDSRKARGQHARANPSFGATPPMQVVDEQRSSNERLRLQCSKIAKERDEVVESVDKCVTDATTALQEPP